MASASARSSEHSGGDTTASPTSATKQELSRVLGEPR